MKKLFLTAAISAILSAPAMAYEAGDTILKFGLAHVSPNDSSGPVLGNDGVSVDANTQLGLTLNYFFSDRLALEVLAATPFTHDINGTGDLAPLGKIADVKHLPPTFTLQYYFAEADSEVQPFLGVGINYTTFFEEDSSKLSAALEADTDLKLSDSLGLSLQGGLDWKLNEKWSFNTSVWYMDIETDADVYVNGAKATTIDVKIDPWVMMAGFAYQF